MLVFYISSSRQGISSGEHNRALTKVSQIDNSPFLFPGPYGNDPLPRGEEDPREITDEKKWDDSYGFDLFQALGKSGNDLHWLFLNQLEIKYFNRNQVLLFVLYHSWRSFLS
ncbi:hypothetical protein [Cyclobacterium plantarum]|uniref:Uncharacterized protein n=1 Tax=Cyclobacterium plantarum TaxID=2716263 RepID=A0ABX0H684_9BACT|nr:hypothetical protein [Cyclobacterium plantarum]NHE55747.1 hypothetical protein [Cyclobacterium plantarum]